MALPLACTTRAERFVVPRLWPGTTSGAKAAKRLSAAKPIPRYRLEQPPDAKEELSMTGVAISPSDCNRPEQRIYLKSAGRIAHNCRQTGNSVRLPHLGTKVEIQLPP